MLAETIYAETNFAIVVAVVAFELIVFAALFRASEFPPFQVEDDARFSSNELSVFLTQFSSMILLKKTKDGKKQTWVNFLISSPAWTNVVFK